MSKVASGLWFFVGLALGGFLIFAGGVLAEETGLAGTPVPVLLMAVGVAVLFGVLKELLWGGAS